MKWFDNTALTIVIIGAVNWLLVGIFRFDLVAFLFGNLTWLSRIIYALVGLCGLYLISMYGRIQSMESYRNAYVYNKKEGYQCDNPLFALCFHSFLSFINAIYERFGI